MTYKMCDKCKKFDHWTPESEMWSVLIKRTKTHPKRIYLCPDCTDKLFAEIEKSNEWRFEHG